MSKKLGIGVIVAIAICGALFFILQEENESGRENARNGGTAAPDGAEIPAAPEGGNWYSRQDRAARLEVLDRQIALSRRHQAACADLGLPYVDVSDPATGLQALRRQLLELTRAAVPARKEKGRSQGPARFGFNWRRA